MSVLWWIDPLLSVRTYLPSVLKLLKPPIEQPEEFWYINSIYLDTIGDRDVSHEMYTIGERDVTLIIKSPEDGHFGIIKICLDKCSRGANDVQVYN